MTSDDGAARFRDLLCLLPIDDPRDDIDTESLRRRFPELAAVIVTELEIPGPHGPMAARRYVGTGTGTGTGTGGDALVWVHGGAFISGSLDMPESHWVGMELASRGVPVLALEYRKALGGVRHPDLSDEVRAGWLAAPEVLGAERIHFGGASAGGNLAAGVVTRLIGDGLALPASLVLVYPVLHSVVPPAGPAAARAVDGLADELRFTPAFMRAINLNYVGEPSGLHDTVAFPAYADVAQFPRTLIVNAEADDLRPSGEAFAVQLGDAGVPVVVDHEPRTVHGYLDVPGESAAIATIERIVDWVRR